jgi:hypothetical protein
MTNPDHDAAFEKAANMRDKGADAARDEERAKNDQAAAVVTIEIFHTDEKTPAGDDVFVIHGSQWKDGVKGRPVGASYCHTKDGPEENAKRRKLAVLSVIELMGKEIPGNF